MAPTPSAKASESSTSIRNASGAPECSKTSTLSISQQKSRLLKVVRKWLGPVDEWMPRSVDVPTCLEDWSLSLLQVLSHTCRNLKTPEACRHFGLLLQRSMEDTNRNQLEESDVRKIARRLKERHSFVNAIRAIWGTDSSVWLGREFEFQARDPMTWPTDVLEVLLNLARQAPTPGRHLRAKRIVYRIAATDMDMLQEEGWNFLPLHVHHVELSCQSFEKLWPASTNTNLVGTLRHRAANSAPDSIEDFGAYDQLSPEDQASADHAVLAAYQNALNRRGAGYGSSRHGPTICTCEFAETPGLGRYTPNKGKLWKGPDVDGQKRSYGKVSRKQSYMRILESHYRCTFAEFLDIPRLRPEEAFYFAEDTLKALVQLKDEFLDLPLETVREALEKQNEMANNEKTSKNKSTFHNITRRVVTDTRAVLRAEAESKAPEAATEDPTHTEEHAHAGEHVEVTVEPAATETAAREAVATESAATEAAAAEVTKAAEAAVEVAQDNFDDPDSSQSSLFNDRPRKRKRVDSVMKIQETTA
ncbi:uncharacterized protein J3D65DRAFT_599913 [Phyllosticta citribraziliensis]|uniref:Uncharacterized protein n=1 Tax=Phyllosticta citribraziliensis TaxID=989973 RepID=A0ABR1M521_9PEZI